MDKINLAYLSDWNFTGIPDNDVAKLTHVNYSFAVIKDGEADTSHWENEPLLMELIAGHKELNVCVSLGGWGAGGFSEAVSDELGREKLSVSIINVIKKYGFKGIDLDWEYPGDSVAGIASSPDDKDNFVLLIKNLRHKLDILEAETGIHYLLTMAVGVTEKCVGNLDFDKMIDALDYVYLMTYDLAPWDGRTGHHTHLYAPEHDANKTCGDSAVKLFMKAGVPAKKLVLGAGFYGRCCNGTEPGDNHGLFQKHGGNVPGTISYAEIIERIAAGTAKRYFDEISKAPYIYDAKQKFFASYEDEESLAYKTKYVEENGLGGLMFWEYNSDKTGFLLDNTIFIKTGQGNPNL